MEAAFCPDCQSACHHKCRRPANGQPEKGRCPTCGGDISAKLAAQVERDRAAATAEESLPATRVFVALGCLELMAVFLLIAGAWTFLNIMSLGDAYREIAMYVGVLFFALVVFMQVIAYGLCKGQAWARLASIALMLLSLVSIALPFAVLGLFMLADGQSWAAYAARKGAGKT